MAMSRQEVKQRWRSRHPEHAREYSREYAKRWRAANPDYGREYAKRWRIMHREEMKEKARRYRVKNREFIKVARGLGISVPEARVLLAVSRQRSSVAQEWRNAAHV
jgi:sugar-specific transcriptional regulator TrmB